MGRALPEVDRSVHWDCPGCQHKHRPNWPCPPLGVWLVLTLCSRCDERTGRYCTWHRERRIAPVEELPQGVADGG